MIYDDPELQIAHTLVAQEVFYDDRTNNASVMNTFCLAKPYPE